MVNIFLTNRILYTYLLLRDIRDTYQGCAYYYYLLTYNLLDTMATDYLGRKTID